MTETRPCDNAIDRMTHTAHHYVRWVPGVVPDRKVQVTNACPGYPVLSDMELPGLWENADLTGGETDTALQDALPGLFPVSAGSRIREVPGGVVVASETPREATERSAVAADLEAWWEAQAQDEIMAVVPKAVEYGSNSLAEQGRLIARLQGREAGHEEALELGAFVYAFGKMQRWCDSVLRGERPSDDTIYDIGVYVKMAQRVRATGDWPGQSEGTK